MLSYHSGLRKTLRWYKKAGVHILEIMLTNSFYLYTKFSTNKEFTYLVKFRESIIKNLVGARKVKPYEKPFASFHYPLTIPESEKKKNPTRKCKQCNQNAIRRETRFIYGYCSDQPALCGYCSDQPALCGYCSDLYTRLPYATHRH